MVRARRTRLRAAAGHSAVTNRPPPRDLRARDLMSAHSLPRPTEVAVRPRLEARRTWFRLNPTTNPSVSSYLPLITDTVIASAISRELASAYLLLQLPPITISCSHEHSAWRGTVSISSSTLHAMIDDIYRSITDSGLTSLVIVNCHGVTMSWPTLFRREILAASGWHSSHLDQIGRTPGNLDGSLRQKRSDRPTISGFRRERKGAARLAGRKFRARAGDPATSITRAATANPALDRQMT